MNKVKEFAFYGADLIERWFEELVSLLPHSVRARVFKRRTNTAVRIDEAGVPFIEQSNDSDITEIQITEPPKGSPFDVRDATVRLAPESVLTKVLTFPASMKAEIKGALKFQLEQHLPMTTQHIYYGYRNLGPTIDGASINVELAAVRRVQLDPVLDQLENCGYLPSSVGVEASDITLNLDRYENARRLKTLVIAGLIVFSITALMLMPSFRADNLADENARLSQQLSDLVQTTRAATVVRQQRDARIADIAFLNDQRERDTFTSVLKTLTEQAPDQIWISEFLFDESTVRVSGSGSGIADWVLELQELEMFENVTLEGISKDQSDGGIERFTISLVVNGSKFQSGSTP